MNKQQRAQQLLREVSTGLSALVQAVRAARSTSSLPRLGAVDQGVQRLQNGVSALEHGLIVLDALPHATGSDRAMGPVVERPLQAVDHPVDHGTVPAQTVEHEPSRDVDEGIVGHRHNDAPVLNDPAVPAEVFNSPTVEPLRDAKALEEPLAAGSALETPEEPPFAAPDVPAHEEDVRIEPLDEEASLPASIVSEARPLEVFDQDPLAPALLEANEALVQTPSVLADQAVDLQPDFTDRTAIDAPVHAQANEDHAANAPAMDHARSPDAEGPTPAQHLDAPAHPPAHKPTDDSLDLVPEPSVELDLGPLSPVVLETETVRPLLENTFDEDDAADDVTDDIQMEALSIFFDEAPSLIEGVEMCFGLIRRRQKTFIKEGYEINAVQELYRLVHTLKGNAGMAGAFRTRTMIHVMENMMEEVVAGRLDVLQVLDDLEKRFADVQRMIDALERHDFTYQLPRTPGIDKDQPSAPMMSTDADQGLGQEALLSMPDSPSPPMAAPASMTQDTSIANKKSVRVNPDLLDRLVNEANEARLTRSGLESTVTMLQAHARDLDENVQGLIKMLRELEIHAESQIQSRRTQIEEMGEDFDPLEFDRFTRLQELTRFLSERAHDMLDLQQGVSRATAEQETLLAYQERSINEIQESLTKTRLIPFEDTTGPLVRMTKLAAKELSKEVDVVTVGGRTELDRALIEKINSPLQHTLRNAVAHGIESREERLASGKPARGEITITVKQDAGRVFITIRDDGSGIRVDKVRKKAIEKGLWNAQTPMSDQEAADLVCLPNFSTVESINELAGRGVGMDAVRSDVLALGGRFDMRSLPGRGLTVLLQVPTTLSTASTLIVEAQGERVAIPVESIEHVLSMKRDEVLLGRERGWIDVSLHGETSHRVDFRYLLSIMGIKVPVVDPTAYNQVVIVRESETVIAVLVDRLLGTQEVPIRPIGRALSRLPGIVGTTVLSDGHAAFVLDPARTRAAFLKQNAPKAPVVDSTFTVPIVEALETQALPHEDSVHAAHRGAPLVMVVDDSLTVRKASARFLQREGFAHVLAKDGQEAVEMLTTVTPDLILLDVEMPRMDGFDFAKHVREHPRHHAVPIIMITSRIAEKHRKRADAIGVNGYLGKPFIEEELLALLHQYTGDVA